MTASRARSNLCSLLLHLAVIAAILYSTTGATPPIARIFPLPFESAERVFLPPADGGGGGGQHELAPPQRGRLPRPAPRVFTPPVVEIRTLAPKLPAEPTILAPSDTVMPVIHIDEWGDPAGILGTRSDGPGTGGGIGTGDGPGVGPGEGLGAGLGRGGGVGGTGSEAEHGITTPPVLLAKIEPSYSEEARKSKISGTVILSIEIDSTGHPRNIRVRRPLGLGLEERAAEAVSRWRFRPAYRNGKPVPCTAEVEVNFRLL